MTGIKAVFFDFDGVLLESADIKTGAFRDLFAGHPRWTERIVRYHLRHAGLSRFKKFEHIYRRFLKIPLPPAERRRLGRAFSRLVYEKVLRCPMVPGARRFLARHAGRLALFVLSGTPQAELRRIVKARRIGIYFRGVYGSPRTKEELARSLLGRLRLSPGEALYVGDARSDWEAARRCRVRFVGRVPAGGRSPFPAGTPMIRDLSGLERRVG